MSEQHEGSRQKLEVNPVQVAASALAAVTSAVVLSTLGTAGTIIGAALGSVFATAGAALYSYSIRVSRERMARVQAAAISKVNRRRAGESTRTVEVAEAAEEAQDQETPAWREALGRLPWKWITIIAGIVFVITMLVIVGFELLTGRSVSTYTGGSDGGGHRTSLGFGSSTHATKSPSPTPSATTSSQPSGTSQAPSESSSPTTVPKQAVTPSTTPSVTPATPSSSAPASSSPSASPSG